MNVGFAKAEIDYPFDCYVFHDVDQIMENDKNLHKCRNRPMHLSHRVSGRGYKVTARFGELVLWEKNCKASYINLVSIMKEG